LGVLFLEISAIQKIGCLYNLNITRETQNNKVETTLLSNSTNVSVCDIEVIRLSKIVKLLTDKMAYISGSLRPDIILLPSNYNQCKRW